MKASFTVGPIELAVSTPPGPLERLIAGRYRWFLGAVRSPALWLMLVPMAGGESVGTEDSPKCHVSGSDVELVHPLFVGRATAGRDGRVQVVPTADAVGGLFETLIAVLAPARGALLLDAPAVMSRGFAHFLLGSGTSLAEGITSSSRVVVSPGRALLTGDEDGWLAEATPFASHGPWPCRAAEVETFWFVEPTATRRAPVGGAFITGAILEHSLLPLRDTSTLAAAFDVAARAGEQVPGAVVPSDDISWANLDEMGGALRVRRALSSSRPEFRSRALHRSLDGRTGRADSSRAEPGHTGTAKDVLGGHDDAAD